MTTLQIIAIVFFAIAIVLLAASITVFFTENIIDVIGFLSGKTAKKQVQQIREQTANMSYGAKRVRSSRRNVIDEMISNNNVTNQANIHNSNQVIQNQRDIIDTPNKSLKRTIDNNGTVSRDNIGDDAKEKIYAADKVIDTENETELLSDEIDTSLENDMETDVLDDEPKDVLNVNSYSNNENHPYYEGETSVLSDDVDETTLLSAYSEETTVLLNETEESNSSFEIIDEQTFINTEEKIE